jgi:hypothetical protein
MLLLCFDGIKPFYFKYHTVKLKVSIICRYCPFICSFKLFSKCKLNIFQTPGNLCIFYCHSQSTINMQTACIFFPTYHLDRITWRSAAILHAMFPWNIIQSSTTISTSYLPLDFPCLSAKRNSQSRLNEAKVHIKKKYSGPSKVERFDSRTKNSVWNSNKNSKVEPWARHCTALCGLYHRESTNNAASWVLLVGLSISASSSPVISV